MLKIDVIVSFSHVFCQNMLDVQLLLVIFVTGTHFLTIVMKIFSHIIAGVIFFFAAPASMVRDI